MTSNDDMETLLTLLFLLSPVLLPHDSQKIHRYATLGKITPFIMGPTLNLWFMIGPGSPRGHQLQAAWRSVLYIHLFIAKIGSLHNVWLCGQEGRCARGYSRIAASAGGEDHGTRCFAWKLKRSPKRRVFQRIDANDINHSQSQPANI